jgi:predicted nucleic acid-binding protein
MDPLDERLTGHQVIGLDTSIFIYHLEAHPRCQPLTRNVLYRIQSGRQTGVTSTVALMELTVQPWQAGHPAMAREYEALLVHFPNLIVTDVTRAVARRAAQLRARYRTRPVDALLVATALIHRATVFVANDRYLERLSSFIDIIILDALVPP